jgi:peptide/nickel transport system permease protein
MSRVTWRDWPIAVFAAIVVVALCAPLLAPHSPLVPAGPPLSAPGKHGFFLGSDEVGRDILSRILYGARSSLFAAGFVVVSSLLVGGFVGTVAGLFGGWVDSLLMRLTDAFLALPAIIMAIAVVAVLGPSLLHTCMALALVWWPYYARLVRGEVRALAARPHLDAARLTGTSNLRLATRHLLPGAVPTLIVATSLDVGQVVVAVALLSYIGLGSPAPAPELGAMSEQGLTYLLTSWWVPSIPALAVLVVALAANLAGDVVRDRAGVVG